ncbi:MAG: hypothetical protein MI807_03515 [Verrucomicrobiales bacterium]|nr:hypothetical protein [Verrucomicrobiales bacterium]
MNVRSLLVLFIASGLCFPAFAQRGDSGRGEIHRSLAELENEFLHCLEEQEAIYSQIEQRNAELSKVHKDRDRAEGKQKSRLSQQIDKLNSANRQGYITISRIGIELQRIKLGIDRLTRYDDHLLTRGGHHGGRGDASSRVVVQSIQNLTFKREGPVRQNGRLGFVDTNVWEITFDDNSKQKLEEKSFTPIR